MRRYAVVVVGVFVVVVAEEDDAEDAGGMTLSAEINSKLKFLLLAAADTDDVIGDDISPAAEQSENLT